MLSRFRMTVELAQLQYAKLGGRVFGSPRRFHYRKPPPLFAPRPKFAATKLSSVFSEVCDAYGHGIRDPAVFASVTLADNNSNNGCKTLVTSLGRYETIKETKVLFRSYEATREEGNFIYPRNPGPACKIPIWMVGRAITAAPTYFKPIQFHDTAGNLWVFKDGGLRVNNPVVEGYEELYNLTKKRPDIVISIGTSHRNRDFFAHAPPGGLRDTINTLKAMLSSAGNTKEAHETMQATYKYIQNENYWRFDDDSEARRKRWKKIKMDEWKCGNNGTLQKMDALVANYLKETDVNLKECAKALVRKRRLRLLANPNRWKEFALPTWNYYPYR